MRRQSGKPHGCATAAVHGARHHFRANGADGCDIGTHVKRIRSPPQNRYRRSAAVCTGLMVRAKPSWAICATFVASLLVNAALVAIMPMVYVRRVGSDDGQAEWPLQ